MSGRNGRKKKVPETVSDLRPATYNPRKMSAAMRERLDASMDKFGDLSGIVFNRRTGNLVGGHQRKVHLPEDAEISISVRLDRPNAQGTVAVGWIQIGEERWSYREVDVPKKREKAMNLAANKHKGLFDEALLPDVLADAYSDVGSVEILGFDPLEAELLLAGHEDFEPVGRGAHRLDQKTPVECPNCGHAFVP